MTNILYIGTKIQHKESANVELGFGGECAAATAEDERVFQDLPRDMHPRKQSRSRSRPWFRDVKPVCEAEVPRFEEGLASAARVVREGRG